MIYTDRVSPLRPYTSTSQSRFFSLLVLWLFAFVAMGCDPTPVKPDGGNNDCGGVCQANEECVQGQFCLPKCTSSETRCGSKCTNTKSDTAHCGGCDKACKTGESCQEGSCKTVSCGADETDCSGTCVNTKSSKDHCGACGKACASDESCQEGTCKKGNCGAGETDCSGTCVNTKTNKSHCGACGNTCGADLTCQDGVCKCQGNAVDCGGTCVDTQSSDAHCGKCGNTCTSPQYCDVGQCVCPTGLTACGSGCVNLKSDTEHCGACDAKCTTGQSCTEGTCKSKCNAPEEECGGRCTNPQTDDQNCGNCGNACASGETCQSGTCAKPCASGETFCGGSCTNTQTDAGHCGSCGNACASGQICAAGSCKVGCLNGQTECSGVCVSLQNDKSHCGKCGNACSGADLCTVGTCAASCASGETDCNGLCVNLQNNPKHCGACGTICASGEVCSAGSCAASCPSGETDCAGTCANTQSSNAHCGTCGTLCTGGKSCQSGTCNCPSGQSDCNGICADTQGDDKNCGTCGNACSNGQICKGGTCQAPCPSGETVCSGACVNTKTNKDHCGMCGTACTGAQVCNNGVCGVSCSANETACDGACVDLKSNDKHCAACGNVCGNGRICQGGSCICPSGLSVCSNACVDLQSSRDHCGACGTACSGTLVCIAGACKNTWTAVLSGASSTRLSSFAANNKGAVYATGTSPKADGTPSIYLQKIGSNAIPEDLSIDSLAHVGFHADLNANITFTNTNWNTITGWRTSGLAGLYNQGGAFDGNKGEFTAPATGYYFFSARVRVDDANTNNNAVEVLFVVDGQTNTTNGALIRHKAPALNEVFPTESVFFLNKGAKVTVQVRSNPDNNYTVQNESGFSGFYLGPKMKYGFQANLNASQTISGTNWTTVRDWRTTGTSGLFANGGGLDASSGEYTVPVDGVYYVSTRIILHDANKRPNLVGSIPQATIEAFLSINGSSPNSDGRYAKVHRNLASNRTLAPGNLLKLKKGDKLSIRVKSEDTSYTVNAESGWSAYYVGDLYAGFNAYLNTKDVTATGWIQLNNFRASGDSTLINASINFNASTGEYTAPANGYYYFGANVMINDANSGSGQYIRMLFAVDGNRDLHRGTHANTAGPSTDGHSLHLGNLLYLTSGQKVTLWFYSHSDNAYSLGGSTSFYGYFVAPSATSVRGIAVETDDNDNLFVAGAARGLLDILEPTTLFVERVFLAKRKTDGVWEWRKYYMVGTPSDLKRSGAGDLFVCGNYVGSWPYAIGKTLQATGTDGFITKLNNVGIPLWALAISSPNSTTQAPKCAVTSTGEAYVMGTFTGTLKLGTITLNSGNATGTFRYLARVKADGSGFEWAKQFGTSVSLSGLATDSAGRVYVAGNFDKTLTLGNTTLTSTNRELFVMAFETNGDIRWSNQTKLQSNAVNSGGIAIFNDQVYIASNFSGRVEFGMTLLRTSGNFDLALAILHSDGRWLSARSVTGLLEDTSPLVTFASDGNLYYSAAFKSLMLTFGLLATSKKNLDSAIYDSVISKNLP